LTIFNTTNGCLEFYSNPNWVSACDGDAVGPLITSGECTGELEVIIFDGLEYRPVESSGRCWLDRNLGATAVTASLRSDYTSDANYVAAESASFGDYYQWGRAADGHEDINSSLYTAVANDPEGVGNANAIGNAWDGEFIARNPPVLFTFMAWLDKTLPNRDNLWQGVNGVNNPCPSGYRIPSRGELEDEIDTWSSTDDVGAFNSPLKFSVSGERGYVNGNFFRQGETGRYWSSTVTTTAGRRVRAMTFSVGGGFSAQTISLDRASGFPVRCIKD
jgi:uncharacterized protein (TIGR02145 family)